ncbi:vault protein inter-alpha-trypsin domain-containing protein [Lentinula edodes]|nr:vault protein inter-alpha-trypsin domain-containing protein [Lentinula edodes]
MARTKIRSPTLGDCRLYDAATGQDLILDGSSAQVLIADIHASVNLSQRFTNTSYTTISSAVYTFGLMAGAAVCGFEMIKQDGTRVEGVVKEKEAAKKEYEQAIQAGKTASLGQQETEDVFSITVGNVLPSETVEINLHYIQPLTDDEKKDQVKFIFPRTYAQRYGQAPTDNTIRRYKEHLLSLRTSNPA